MICCPVLNFHFWPWTVWRYLRGNQKPLIEEGQTMQLPKKEQHNNIQHTTQKTKDWATRTSLKPGINPSNPEEQAVPVLHVTPVTHMTHPVISHEWGKDRIVISTKGSYPWSFVTRRHRVSVMVNQTKEVAFSNSYFRTEYRHTHLI